jgi:hypothetical protein
MAEVEHEKLPGAPGPLRSREHAAQQVDVALGVEHDHDLAAADVLGDQQLGQARLASAYTAFKDWVAERLLDKFGRHFPALASRVRFHEAATPVAQHHFLGAVGARCTE